VALKDKGPFVVLLSVAEFEDETAIVLRDMGAGPEPFATHFRARDGESFYFGHYFEKEVDARADFENRVTRNLARVRAKGHTAL
jgi:hypothetical protein